MVRTHGHVRGAVACVVMGVGLGLGATVAASSGGGPPAAASPAPPVVTQSWDADGTMAVEVRADAGTEVSVSSLGETVTVKAAGATWSFTPPSGKQVAVRFFHPPQPPAPTFPAAGSVTRGATEDPQPAAKGPSAESGATAGQPGLSNQSTAKHGDTAGQANADKQAAAKPCTCADTPDSITETSKRIQCIHTLLTKLADKDLSPADAECDRLAIQTYQTALRQRLDNLQTTVSDAQKELLKPDLNDTTKANDQEIVSNGKPEIDLIRSELGIQDTGFLRGFDDFDRFFYQFSLGYQYTNLKDFGGKGFPLAGLLLGLHLGGRNIPPDQIGASLKYGTYWTSTFSLNDTATNSKTASSAGTAPTVEKDLEAETQFYWPVARTGFVTKQQGIREYFGPILIAGGRKIDSVSRVYAHWFAGLRAALSEEVYADFLVGRMWNPTQSTIDNTWGSKVRTYGKVRGQLQVAKFADDSRLFLGADGTFALDRSPVPNQDLDTVRLYVVWNTDFTKIFSGLSGGGAPKSP